MLAQKHYSAEMSAVVLKTLEGADLPTEDQMEFWKDHAGILPVPVMDDNTDTATEKLSEFRKDNDFNDFYESLTRNEKEDLLLKMIAREDIISLRGYHRGGERQQRRRLCTERR